ncbi:1-phosphofructokinase [Aquibacillus koreensis]|uniref:Tagatose-6-phosphate kinase n=1 Tax=Aquibacillus koreensis TaxID=279446 RepID=A0A9X3WND3_9BACI|nr:1-phosphofructokinase [Aquibacillus koreensis]MCT2536023.1 1-phosphofructokinase [Aquibacillus koreensis]MDC3420479.1 1-phosphofructokinase [Aquibacillus koreensis]
MIYTCTLNPSVDYIIHVEDFQVNGLNRGTNTQYYPGGKGINVSRVLKRLDVENTALGFLGGFSGDFIKDQLHQAEIETNFIEVSGNTRINMKLKSSGETEINGPGPEITSNQLQQLYDQISSLKQGDFLVAAGSTPASVPATFYADVAKICERNGVKLIVDTSSQALKDVMNHKLFFVKPNHHELGELFDTTIDSLDDAIHYGKKLQQQGPEHVIVSMGGDGAIYISEQACYLAKAPKGTVKNTVGAGDSLVSGFLSAYVREQTVLSAFQYAVATGSATAFSNDLCTKEEVQQLFEQVKINPIE